MKRVGRLIAILAFCVGCSSEMTPPPDGIDPGGTDPGGTDPGDGLLAPPPADQGFQVQLEPFMVEPGQEVYWCYTVDWPVDGEFDVERIQEKFSLGVHHLLVSTIDKQYPAGNGPCGNENTFGHGVPLQDVFFNNLRFLGGAQTPYAENPESDLALEPGMAFKIRDNSSLLFQIHWLNTTDQPIEADSAVNFWYARTEVTRYLESFFFYHTAIDLPPHQQTEVAARCTFPQDIEVVGMVSHMHQRGTHYTTHAIDSQGTPTELVYEETRWQDPTMKMWPSSNLLELSAGEGLEYRCFFDNETDQSISEGSGANDEMCMLVGLYAGGTSTIWGFPGTQAPGNACVDTP